MFGRAALPAILAILLLSDAVVTSEPRIAGSPAQAKVGLPFTIKNESAQPWVRTSHVDSEPWQPLPVAARGSCNGPSPDNPSTFWYEAIAHNGQSSFMASSYKSGYSVVRNVVTDFGADNTGTKDASAAIQKAINAGASGGPDRTSGQMGSTGQPAIVYLPAGTYLMTGSIQLFVGTALVGNALHPPVLKAAAGFPNDHVVYAKDPHFDGTTNFYIGIKNLVIDSTAVAASQSIALLDWTVSQGTQLANVVFNMSDFSNHTGVTSQYGYNSQIILNDLTFYGGACAMSLSGQQWVLKNIHIDGSNVGVKAGGFNLVCLKCVFLHGQTGIDASGISGSLTVIDSSATSLGGALVSNPSSTGTSAGAAVILDNVWVNGAQVASVGGNLVVTANLTNTWVRGSIYRNGSTSPLYQAGAQITTPRSSDLLGSDSTYITVPPPTYAQYSVSQFVNVKNVAGLPVLGDGATDDTANINAILAQVAGCKIIYFPAGTYIVTSTIFVPPGSRIIGDAYASVISAAGTFFGNANAPQPMIRVGNAGDVGVAQISDIIFTVADILPGCQLVEVNMAGGSPGDVGFWNSHFRIGGAAGSRVDTACPKGTTDPADCKAAFGILHLTSTSSAYIENMWGWTADHDMDGAEGQLTVSTGRGMLVEATRGTWLVGTAMEHHTLYQYNFDFAQDVFSAFQQSETPYWQGTGSIRLAPDPWTNNLIASDPTFSSCATSDGLCRMALFERIQGASNLFLYGGCDWVFFDNYGSCSGDCQQNAIEILTSSPSLYLYGTNVKGITNIVLEGAVDAAVENTNSGGWGGVVAAYIHNSGTSVSAPKSSSSSASRSMSASSNSELVTTTHTGSSAMPTSTSASSRSLPTVSPAVDTPTATTTLANITLTVQPAADPTVVVVDPNSHQQVHFAEEVVSQHELSELPVVVPQGSVPLALVVYLDMQEGSALKVRAAGQDSSTLTTVTLNSDAIIVYPLDPLPSGATVSLFPDASSFPGGSNATIAGLGPFNQIIPLDPTLSATSSTSSTTSSTTTSTTSSVACSTNPPSCDASNCQGSFSTSTGIARCTTPSQLGCLCMATSNTCGTPQSCDSNYCQGQFNLSTGISYCTNFFKGCQCTPTQNTCGTPQSCDGNNCNGAFNGLAQFPQCTNFFDTCQCQATSNTCGSPQSCDNNGCAGAFEGNVPMATCQGNFVGCECSATSNTCGNPQSCDNNGCNGAFWGNVANPQCTGNFVGCQCQPTSNTCGSPQSCDNNGCLGAFEGNVPMATCQGNFLGCECWATSNTCGQPQSCSWNGCNGAFDGNVPLAFCQGNFLGCQCTPSGETCGNPQSCDLNGCAGAFDIGATYPSCRGNFQGCICSPTSNTCGPPQSCSSGGCDGSVDGNNVATCKGNYFGCVCDMPGSNVEGQSPPPASSSSAPPPSLPPLESVWYCVGVQEEWDCNSVAGNTPGGSACTTSWSLAAKNMATGDLQQNYDNGVGHSTTDLCNAWINGAQIVCNGDITQQCSGYDRAFYNSRTCRTYCPSIDPYDCYDDPGALSGGSMARTLICDRWW